MYRMNPNKRVDALETKINEEIVCCAEAEGEAYREGAYGFQERMGNRIAQLERRLELVAKIQARMEGAAK